MVKCEYYHCSVEFEPVRPGQRFHSTACRFKEWERLHPRLGKGLEALLPPKGTASKPHCGHPGRSRRLSQTLNVFYDIPNPTTLQIQERTGSMKPSTDIDDLRRAGYPISRAKYVMTTAEGRRVYQYQLVV